MEVKIRKNDLSKWLDRLKMAWLNKDINEVSKIFETTTKYYETPFDLPGTNIEDIKKFWAEINTQNIIDLQFTPLVIEGDKTVVNWYLKYSEIDNTQNIIELDGIYYIIFNDNFECIEFKQWWVSKE